MLHKNFHAPKDMNYPPAIPGNHLYIGRVHNVYRLLQIEFSFDKFHITTFDNIISLFAKAAKNYNLYPLFCFFF